MARLQLYKHVKNKDFEFIDRIVKEYFFVSGTAIHVHKYLGIHEQDDLDDFGQKLDFTTNYKKNPKIPETEIQDLMFLENRDRKYSEDIIELWGHYTLSDHELELSQLGMLLLDDGMHISFHIGDTMERLGRKPMPGDVFELPHLLDDTGLDPSKGAMKKFYLVEDVTRSSEGFDALWRPHVIRVRVKALKDSPEYDDIFSQKNEEGYDLQEIISTFNENKNITEAIHKQAEKETPRIGADKSHLFGDGSFDSLSRANVLEVVSHGLITDELETGFPYWVEAAGFGSELRIHYDEQGDPHIILGRITADEVDVFECGTINDVTGALPLRFGNEFPDDAGEGAFFLRIDFMPHRLFRKQGTSWMKVADDERPEWDALVRRYTHQSGVKNIDGIDMDTKSSLSKAGKAVRKPVLAEADR